MERSGYEPRYRHEATTGIFPNISVPSYVHLAHMKVFSVDHQSLLQDEHLITAWHHLPVSTVAFSPLILCSAHVLVGNNRGRTCGCEEAF